MPKEDPVHPPPLRRGDACLYCRKRRIRCSADKPTCQHCAKTGRECIYDSGKPVSRVKQLEEKVAELETLLKSGIASAGNGNGNGSEPSTSRKESISSASVPPLQHHSSSDQSIPTSADATMDDGAEQAGPSSYTQLPDPHSSTSYSYDAAATVAASETFDFNMLDAFLSTQSGLPPSTFASFGGSFFSGTIDVGDPVQAVQPGSNFGMNMVMDGMGVNAESSFDFNMLDPNYMSLIHSFQATTTTTASTAAAPSTSNTMSGPSSTTYTRPATSSTSPSSAHSSTTGQAPIDPKYYNPNTSTCPPYLNDTSSQNAARSSGSPFHSTRPPNFRATTLNPGPYSIEELLATDPSDEPDVALRNRLLSSVPDKRLAELLRGTDIQPPADASPPACTLPAQRDGQQWVTGITDSSTEYQPAGVGTHGPIDTEPTTDPAEGFTLVGGWFDAADLPKIARDHLLDLFFSGMRLFGQEFHVPRFMASLTLPPAKRPHPCLLYSMYTLASRISTSAPIRSLEPHFYSIASRQLEESIGHADRLLDATRASTLLAIYKYSKARYHEGWMMTGQAARLALSCGLHQIRSSVWKPSSILMENADLIGMMRHRSYVIPAAKDAVEHGERIWTFWSIYTTDRCGSISTQWPPAINDDDVCTPFPRPLHEYELGLVTEDDDQSLSTIYRPSPFHRPLPHYTEKTLISIRLRAISILERSSKLMYLHPEDGWDTAFSTSASASSADSPENPNYSGIDDYLIQQMAFAAGLNPVDSDPSKRPRLKGGWTRTARIRTPKAYEEVKSALLRIEADLPPEWRTNWFVWDGKVQDWHFGKPRKDLITLHFVLGCAWMFLFDVFSFNAENHDAVNVAKRLTVTVRFVSKEVMVSDLDVFIAMTWSFISKILIREMKRLQAMGDTSGVASLEADIETLISALRQFGQRYTMGTMQAMRAERYKKSTMEQMAFMSSVEGEEVDDVPEEGEVSYQRRGWDAVDDLDTEKVA
ncbi:hypothetical protein I316_03836 [Kwoniella heveanensis BCC8398]|uniref:Zn(2)-C6 fungal-type domain-containing protein n=1 Tax=Kwoniella heveanensis BCC8398 TaxID=1296120 RepID=A0A1B9GTC7_9TREE|nr:hypothetical protein I316_03836 [Kwoniella heveanensis BCC8398]